MRVDDFNYMLPDQLIAQDPLEPRDSSRLLILDKNSGMVRHSIFNQIGKELKKGDLLVVNDTKVLPARLFAQKSIGATIEILLLKQVEINLWQCMVKPGKKALPGVKLVFAEGKLEATIDDFADEGTRLIRFYPNGDFFAVLDELGTMPLPPYIKKTLKDQNRYQPIYAREKGSAAAPTAGLHFTNRLMDQLADEGIGITNIMLHVGLGTFRPVKSDHVEEHQMHSEFYRVPKEAADKINETREAGGRIIAVGTTAVRTLETVASDDGHLEVSEGWTQKYIYPGYQFKIVDGMITNFHFPKSSLIMLVAAFAGRENVLDAYQTAIDEEYRFFSFGDAMLIL